VKKDSNFWDLVIASAAADISVDVLRSIVVVPSTTPTYHTQRFYDVFFEVRMLFIAGDRANDPPE
jgi:hypothetical protein